MHVIAISVREADTESYRLTSLTVLPCKTSEQILRGKIMNYVGVSEK